jgi:hypothetical protein
MGNLPHGDIYESPPGGHGGDVTDLKTLDALRLILRASNDTPLENVDWAGVIRLHDQYRKDQEFTGATYGK